MGENVNHLFIKNETNNKTIAVTSILQYNLNWIPTTDIYFVE